MPKNNLFQTAVSAVQETPSTDRRIAIIGFSVVIPGATDESSLLTLLKDGRDQMRQYPMHRRDDVSRFVDYYTHRQSHETRFFRGAWLDRVDLFDREQFDMSEAEANLCDPHQRLFLQTAWQAINDAGYGGNALNASRTAVITCGDTRKGIGYQQLVTEQAFDLLPLSLTGNFASYAPGRLAFLFDLNGPASVVDTGCCSSLVGVHDACRGLERREYDYALVGSAELNFLPLDTGLRVGIESGDGANRSFADTATGTGYGEGAIAVLLKRYSDAVQDGDAIHAVIEGSAVNHGGQGVSLTTPSPTAQADVITTAWNKAQVTAEQFGYVEAHGTATKIGDPIEWQGLSLAFGQKTLQPQTCAVGSFKSYIGHLMNCAGLAGLVRAAMSVKHAQLFPSLHFGAPNTGIDFLSSPLFLNDRLQPWPKAERPVAGVSSFGMSGTNCHIVVAQSEAHAQAEVLQEPTVLLLSGRSDEMLREHARRVLAWYRQNQDAPLGDVAATLAFGREHLETRLALVAQNAAEAIQALAHFVDGTPAANIWTGDAPPVAGDALSAAATCAKRFVSDGKVPRSLPGVARFSRVHLPLPPLQLTRHWLNPSDTCLFDDYDPINSDAARSGTPEANTTASLFDFVSGVFASRLGVPSVDPNTELSDLGANSMAIIQITTELSKKFDVVLMDVYRHPTVTALTAFLAKRAGIEAGSDEAQQDKSAIFAQYVKLADQTLLDDAAVADQMETYRTQIRDTLAKDAAATKHAKIQKVFLTGTTGFIGIHFLHHLLEKTLATVTAHVRGANERVAFERLAKLYEWYHGADLSEALKDGRLSICIGDLATRRFGLEEAQWNALADETDDVIHLAARVRHSGDEAEFDRDNVATTEQIIDLCQTASGSRLHFASSMAVGGGELTNKASVNLFTEFVQELGRHDSNPYSRTKVEGERMIRAARANGLEAEIYRFGNAMFRSTDGKFQANASENGIFALLRGFVELGCWPDRSRPELDLGNIDTMTDAFFAVFDLKRTHNTPIHLFNNNRVSINTICEMLVKHGFEMKKLPLQQFIERAEDMASSSQHASTFSRVLFHLGYLNFDPNNKRTAFWRRESQYSVQLLEQMGTRWLHLKDVHFERMITEAIASGVFPEPKTTAPAREPVEI